MNADIFANFICLYFNYSVVELYWVVFREFPQEFNRVHIIPIHKNKGKVIILINNLSTFPHLLENLQKVNFTINFVIIVIIESAKDTVLTIACQQFREV